MQRDSAFSSVVRGPVGVPGCTASGESASTSEKIYPLDFTLIPHGNDRVSGFECDSYELFQAERNLNSPTIAWKT